ncbi:hypothetical protein TruAng_003626 [Truncatella angustata]|nr:hypothetical protein TruAng_003626 [Truncatella angustata]
MAPSRTLADLYASLNKVNEELRTSRQALPLATSKLANGSFAAGNSGKPSRDAALQRRALEAKQSSLRATIRAESNHGIRPLDIRDLPDEILCQVFTHVRGAPYVEEADGLECLRYTAKDIKNVRLVCRWFCDVSSDMLLSFLEIDITPESILRVQEISQHPIIRKGVHAVKIRMQVYSQFLAESLATFGAYHIGQLRKEIRRLEGLREWSNIEKDIKKANLIIAAWAALFQDASDPFYTQDERYLPYQVLFKEAHEEYVGRGKSQRDIMKNGAFLRAVRAAIDTMPRIMGLHICGGSWFDNVRINFGILKSDDILRQALLLPMAFQETERIDVKEHRLLLEMITKLPCGIRTEAKPGRNGTKGHEPLCYALQLGRLTISNIRVTQPWLEYLCDSVHGSAVQITLKDLNLCSGTWASVLNYMRQNHNANEWFLTNPAGAECDEFPSEEKRRIFGNPRSRSTDSLSLAERYIARYPDSTNPLAIAEDVE